jgi:hypothetical protein
LDKLLILSRSSHKHSAWLDYVIEKHYEAEYKRVAWYQDAGVKPELIEFKNWSGLN